MGVHSRRARGQHFLTARAAADLVEHSGVTSADVVVDLGAGAGALTDALSKRARRVLAIELDETLVAGLRGRFADNRRVAVVHGDATRARLPEQRFRVVANIPFSETTAILRRLLDDPRVPMDRADLVVQWGAAIKRARTLPATLLGTSWRPWFEITISRRLPPDAFRPPPSVRAAVLTVTRRPDELLDVQERDRYVRFLRHAFTASTIGQVVPRGGALRAVGARVDARPSELDVAQWVEIYRRCRRAHA